MASYLLKRLLLLALVAWGATAAVFVLLRVVPGDVATAVLGPEGTANPQAAARLREALGLDRPLVVQYLRWVGGLLRLDPGHSLWRGVPVWELVAPKAAVTAELALLSLAAGVTVAVPAGVLAARFPGTWVDGAVRLFTVGGLAVPGFWLGILVVLALASHAGYFPFLVYRPLTGDPWGHLQQLAIPALVLGWRLAAVTARMVRASLLEALREDYVRTARAKGLPERAVVGRHALRNASLPVVTLVGFQAGHLLGGTVVIEQVFNLPGLGRALVDAVLARDYPVVQLLVLGFALAMLAVTLLVDLAYAWLDPRVRYR